MQHEKSATQKQKYNLRRVEREKVEHEKSATWKECNTKKAQHGKSPTQKSVKKTK